MRKILFITSFTPSEFSAGQNYTLNLLEDIGSRYRIDLVYFQYENQVYTPQNSNVTIIKTVRFSLWHRIINCILCPFFHPVFSVRFSFPLFFSLTNLLRRNSYDIIYFDFSQVFLYGAFLKHHQKIFMAHDIIHQRFVRHGFWLERVWVFWSEKFVLTRKGIRLFTFSEKDRLLIKENYYRESEVVSFYLSPKILSLGNQIVVSEDYFCFFAAWNRPENYEGLEWFIHYVLPFTKNEKYIVVGINLPGRLADDILKRDNIRYVGFIQNPYELLAGAKALIAPIFNGAGVKVKVIEAMACGTPVIGTAIALDGITQVVEESLLECNTASEFINAIQQVGFLPEKKMRLREVFQKSYLRNKNTVL
jgi:glycosyltransferase involved in cell wall biosynthesis